jgi:hypothetical protein
MACIIVESGNNGLARNASGKAVAICSTSCLTFACGHTYIEVRDVDRKAGCEIITEEGQILYVDSD